MSDGLIEAVLDIATERHKILAALKEACRDDDKETIIRLAKQYCGIEEHHAKERHRTHSRFNRRASSSR